MAEHTPYYIPDYDYDPDHYVSPGSILLGPGGFECVLGEPEDRSWYRDGKEAVAKLNEQYDKITELEELIELLDNHIMDVVELLDS